MKKYSNMTFVEKLHRELSAAEKLGYRMELREITVLMATLEKRKQPVPLKEYKSRLRAIRKDAKP